MADEAETYQSLRDAGAREFLIDGPNSGGVAGLLCHDGQVWWFVADWEPQLGAPMSYDDFLVVSESSTNRGYQEAAAFIRQAIG